MKFAVLFLGAVLGLLAAQGTGNDCPHKKSATLLPSFTVTPTATESTTSHRTTKSHSTTTTGTSHGPTTATHNPVTMTSHGNTTVHPTSNSTATSPGSFTSNSTATSPGSFTSSPHPGPPPPSPSPSPGSKAAVGDYTWTNGSLPCVHLQAQIQIRILYPTQGGREAWGISVLNPNKTTPQRGCEGTTAEHCLPDYVAVEYNVSFPQATQWTFSVQNSSLRELQAPLGQSFSCRNASIILSPAFHLDLLFLKLQAAHLTPTGGLWANDQSTWLPLIIGLIALGLLTLVLVIFCISRRRSPAYQPL
ncbi:hypothetical protein QTO34_009589 [Cnephaeus nilssonii]|uniref:Lysosome-associated membrane glycoprotein 2-like luminal domain-containing protein n=1 Tax=Cnephaeus nilssonii TaxID=3371016 RepID=A0AA40HI53_CNENI|nr:hypothetical protein QTO34_009589 [Eptesicus nilssonii]